STFSKWWTDQTDPIIIDVVQSNDNPVVGEDVVITAHITDNVGVSYVTILYGGGDYAMVLDSGDITDGYWIHTIPDPGIETTITYTIIASDEAGNEVTYGPHEKYWSLPTYRLLAKGCGWIRYPWFFLGGITCRGCAELYILGGESIKLVIYNIWGRVKWYREWVIYKSYEYDLKGEHVTVYKCIDPENIWKGRFTVKIYENGKSVVLGYGRRAGFHGSLVIN
ncbi:hypothetical protein KAS14_06905, partial [Candidatus Bathyarchaeota archaeon]|nr:hypothetical protein [Candidatus Bathyarchaeota archaeon]